jgi:hypothetical protein
MKKTLRVVILSGALTLLASPVFAGPGGTDPPPPPPPPGTQLVTVATAVAAVLGYLGL